MGTFSIWHWIIVLMYFGVPLIPIALANREVRLSRMPYFQRVLVLLISGFALLVLAADFDGGGLIWFALFLSAAVAIQVYLCLWSVHRVQDIGWSRLLNLLLIVPTANVIFVLAILVWPSRKIEEPQEASS